jgi:hypothetical protein
MLWTKRRLAKIKIYKHPPCLEIIAHLEPLLCNNFEIINCISNEK